MSTYNIEDVARFAEGDMTEEEHVQFQTVLQTDSELQASLNFYRTVHSSLKMSLRNDDGDQKFKESLNRISTSHFKKEAKVVPLQKYIAWTGAIAAVFVLFFVWAPWHKDLYQQYSPTEMLVMTERSDTNTDSLMLLASDAFNKKDFAIAKDALATINKNESDNAMAQYYYGISLLETGEVVLSRETLSKVFNGVSIFKYDAAFYISLGYLKEKDNVQAINWLKNIPADAANFDKAQELLNKIK